VALVGNCVWLGLSACGGPAVEGDRVVSILRTASLSDVLRAYPRLVFSSGIGELALVIQRDQTRGALEALYHAEWKKRGFHQSP
jgi:hypothetical protein